MEVFYLPKAFFSLQMVQKARLVIDLATVFWKTTLNGHLLIGSASKSSTESHNIVGMGILEH